MSPETHPNSRDPGGETDGPDKTHMKISQGNLDALKSVKAKRGLGSLDAAVALLIDSHSLSERWSALGAPPSIAQKLAEVDRGLSALLILSRENLILAERLESGAVGREIALGNALAKEIEALSNLKGRPA